MVAVHGEFLGEHLPVRVHLEAHDLPLLVQREGDLREAVLLEKGAPLLFAGGEETSAETGSAAPLPRVHRFGACHEEVRLGVLHVLRL